MHGLAEMITCITFHRRLRHKPVVKSMRYTSLSEPRLPHPSPCVLHLILTCFSCCPLLCGKPWAALLKPCVSGLLLCRACVT
jgi:hypothetical protein